jgi:hypothetical protein
MPFLYRTPLIVRRRQPYIDWANATDAEPPMTEELAQTPAVYLVEAAEEDPTVDQLLAEYWLEIFEQELAGWMEDETSWPEGRSLEMFRAWFDVAVGQGVVDLDPDAPITEDDLDAEEVAYAMNVCAWCGTELTDHGREVPIAVTDAAWLEERRGRAVQIVVDEEHAPMGVVPPAEDAGLPRAEIVFHACSRECMQAITKRVPAALKQHRHHVH